MTHSRMLCIGGVLALLALAPLDCRQAILQKTTRPPENSADSFSAPRVRGVAVADKEAKPKSSGDSPDALRADEVTDIDENDTPGNSGKLSNATKPLEPPWRTAHRTERERIQRERQARARADWKIAIRTDSSTIVPCQPLYVTIKVTNTTDQARKLDELLRSSSIWVLAGRSSEQPRVVNKSSGEELIVFRQIADDQQTVVPDRSSVFFDRLLTIEQIDGGWSQNADGSWSRTPEAKRIFDEPGEYRVYAAVVNSSKRFEVLRSEPLVVTVREPAESEVPYVEFLREGRQIPPLYGFSKVDEEAYNKVLGQGQRTAAFRRKLNAESINTLRAMLAKNPDPPVADDMRHYLEVKLIEAAERYDDEGRYLGHDLDVLAAAARQYLDIDPNRKQLRRRSIKTWERLSTRFDLDHAEPMFQILASWRVSSPFYEDEVDLQAALDEIIAKIEARYAQHARARASAPPPKPKALPTN